MYCLRIMHGDNFELINTILNLTMQEALDFVKFHSESEKSNEICSYEIYQVDALLSLGGR